MPRCSPLVAHCTRTVLLPTQLLKQSTSAVGSRADPGSRGPIASQKDQEVYSHKRVFLLVRRSEGCRGRGLHPQAPTPNATKSRGERSFGMKLRRGESGVIPERRNAQELGTSAKILRIPRSSRPIVCPDPSARLLLPVPCPCLSENERYWCRGRCESYGRPATETERDLPALYPADAKASRTL